MRFPRALATTVLLSLGAWNNTSHVRAQEPASAPAKDNGNGADEKSANGKKPKTLFEWAIGCKDSKENGGDEEEKPKRVDPDRPHFPEASSTVGLGHVVLESGWTFNSQGGDFHSHSYPEANLRIGMFAEWFELRIQQNFISLGQSLEGDTVRDNGAQDLSLGCKLALTEQKKFLPESAIILQMTVPTGLNVYSSGHVEPGVNYDFSWEVVKNKFSLEGVVSANGITAVSTSPERFGSPVTYVQYAASMSAVFDVTRNLQFFTEYYGLFPAGSHDSSIGPQDYVVAGLVYYFTDNFLIDMRGGVGLNDHSNDYLVGAGFVVRY